MEKTEKEHIDLIEREMLHPDLPSAVSEYWEIFKRENIGKAGVFSVLLNFLRNNRASLLDFYLAALFTKNSSLEYNFDCIQAMRQTFDNRQLHAQPYEIWKVLEDHIVYNGADGSFAFHTPHRSQVTRNSKASADYLETRFNQISLIGSKPLLGKCLSALSLLKAKMPEELQFIEMYIERIVETHEREIAIEPGVATLKMSSDVFRASISWCASSISCEAHRMKLSDDYIRQNPGAKGISSQYKSKAAKNICLTNMLRVLKCINAPSSEIDYLLEYEARV